MEQMVERLNERMQSLTPHQLAEVEKFVSSLQTWEQDVALSRTLAPLSESTFTAIWNNPEDEAYDAL